MTKARLTVADGHNHALAIVRSPLARALAPDAAPPVFPSHDALMGQAAFITEVRHDAKLAAERDGWDALARARQQRDRRRRLEQLPRRGGRPEPGRLAVRAMSGALDGPTCRVSTLDRDSYLAGLRARSQRGSRRRQNTGRLGVR